jgi:hypothetical protein
MSTDKIIFTISYALVIIGSVGMIVFAFKFPLASGISQLKDTSERFLGLKGYQVWVYSWVAILLGTAGQLIATWY